LYGEIQLVYFQEIREYLRKNDEVPFALELVNRTAADHQMHMFPPIVTKQNKPSAMRRSTVMHKSGSMNFASALEDQIGRLY
jgi:hypothetical protein